MGEHGIVYCAPGHECWDWAYPASGSLPPTATPTATSATPTVTATPTGGTGLRGQYYDTDDFTDLRVVRVDPIIEFGWGGDAPDPSMDGDTFTVRWTGEVAALTTEDYTFFGNGDDGIRLWVDGQLIFDALDTGTGTGDGAIALVAGQRVPIVVEYREIGGSANVDLDWESAQVPRQRVPTSQLYPDTTPIVTPTPTATATPTATPIGGVGTGLLGVYHNGTSFSDARAYHAAEAVDFSWGGGVADPAQPDADSFSVRWTGELEPPISGSYTVWVRSDDGAMLTIDGQALFDGLAVAGEETRTATISLAGGVRVPIVLDYIESGGDAQVQLEWAYAGQTRQVVPASQLYPASAPSWTPTMTPTMTPTATPTDSGSGQRRAPVYMIMRVKPVAGAAATPTRTPTVTPVTPSRTPARSTATGTTTATATPTATRTPTRSAMETRTATLGTDQVTRIPARNAGSAARRPVVLLPFLTGGATTSGPVASAPRTGSKGGTTQSFAPVTTVTRYSYDGLRRMTGATEDGGLATSYGYDLVGNVTSRTIAGVTVTSAYDAANQDVSASYDAAGSLLKDAACLGDPLCVAATYDALGRLTQQGGTRFGYNGDGTLTAEITGAQTTAYLHDQALPLSQILGDGATTYRYGLDRLASVQGTTRTWQIPDALGSVRAQLTDAGVVVATSRYDAWGAPRQSQQGRFGFTGELQRPDGDVYLRARWYQPQRQTFASVDPFAGFAETPYSLHAYQYGYSQPNRLMDPSGRCVSGGSRADCQSEVLITSPSPATISSQQNFPKTQCPENNEPAEPGVSSIAQQLAMYGFDVKDLGNWKVNELIIIKMAILDFMYEAKWNINKFKGQIIDSYYIKVDLNRYKVFTQPDFVKHKLAAATYVIPRRWIDFNDLAFVGVDVSAAKALVVHEFAHLWDGAREQKSRKMEEVTASSTGFPVPLFDTGSYRPNGYVASEYATYNRREDWGEAVAGVVYEKDRLPRYTDIYGRRNMDFARWCFVKEQFEVSAQYCRE